MPESPRSLFGSTLSTMRRAMRAVIWWVTAVMGDRDYDRYLAHQRAHHPGEPVLSERDYWRDRYAALDSNPGTRCC